MRCGSVGSFQCNKGTREETGLHVSAERLIAIQDWRLHNVRNYVYGVIKIFVLCKSTGGSFAENIETTGIGYFNRDELPANLATEKTTAEKFKCALTQIMIIIGKRSLIKIRNSGYYSSVLSIVCKIRFL